MANAKQPILKNTPSPKTATRKPLDMDRIFAALLLIPSIILVGIFVYGFIGQTMYTSLTDWGRDPAQALALEPQLKYIGFENYKELFTGLLDQRFRQDLVSTLFFTVFFIAGSLGMGLVLAVMLDQNPKGESFFRTLFLFPMSLSFIVTGTIWRWLLQPEGGFNQLFGTQFQWLNSRDQIFQFNWQDIPFYTALVVGLVFFWIAYQAFTQRNQTRMIVALVSALVLIVWGSIWGRGAEWLYPLPETHGFNLAFVGIIIAAVWQMAGYTMALYLAGIRGVPEDLREAARVDGCTEIQIYQKVIFPLLTPITLSAIIILGHISLKIFDLVFAMAGADNATTDVPALLMYLTSFRSNQFAKGAAISMVLLVMVAAVIVPYLYTSLRKDRR
ncbi:carbohydrate ABC transporter permease [Deinococcus misasensis]|uniref:carbohydrate ABC transporter permease n=1 Tax=Deinococcus misasensis TaxID=392413 RepID=UPI000A047634|nr:sugar ABC transporter permease [Deinococcus misasensis]